MWELKIKVDNNTIRNSLYEYLYFKMGIPEHKELDAREATFKTHIVKNRQYITLNIVEAEMLSRILIYISKYCDVLWALKIQRLEVMDQS